MKNKFVKYSVILLSVFLVFSIYKYAKPKVVIIGETIDESIPVKIDWYRDENYFGDSVLVYLPYKFKIQNNRLRRVSVGNLHYRSNPTPMESSLFFDSEGNQFRNNINTRQKQQLALDSLLHEKKFFQYTKLKNNDIVLPFSSRSVYYYKPYKMNKSLLDKMISKEDYVKLSQYFHYQQQENLFAAAEYKIPQKVIDSLYDAGKKENLFFTFKKKSNLKYGFYRIKYQLQDGEQFFTDYYDSIKNMTKEELYEFLKKHPYDE